MIIAGFQVEDKLGRARFFQESFLLAETSIKIVIGMLFFTLSNASMQFAEKTLMWRSYTATEALPTTKRLELINKKEFAKIALDEKFETFVLHVVTLKAPLVGIAIYLSPKAQILALIKDKALTQVSLKYVD